MLITLFHKAKRAVYVVSVKDLKVIRIINITVQDIPT